MDKPESGSIVLHRWELGDRWWLTDASVTEAGNLVISSGDSETEWQAIVAAGQFDALARALVDSIYFPISPTTGILNLLFARFGRGGINPFDDIKQFLRDNAIPFESQVW